MEDSGIDSGDHVADPSTKPTGSDSSSAGSSRSPPRSFSSSRQLQRKLEARIEHAKRLHQEYHATPGLIPIQRLPIPGAKDHQPLVQWDTDDRIPLFLSQVLCQYLENCANNEEKYETKLQLCHLVSFYPSVLGLSEEDIVNFFPLSRKESRVHQELTDTFSIEEMSISGDDEEEEDLHLVPPQTVYKKFGCCPFSFCVIM